MFEKYKKLIFIDVETDGLNYEKNSIIELGALVLSKQSNGKFVITEEINVLVKIDGFLPPKITEITGITDEMLEKDGIEREEFNQILIKLFADAKDDTLLIAYNTQFDANFIDKIVPLKCDMLDVMAIFKDRHAYNPIVVDGKKLGHTLNSAVRKYNVKIKNTHRALDDVKATFEVMVAMMKENKDTFEQYLNIFGYNPRYKINGKQFSQIRYIPQNIYERNAILNRL